MKTRIEQVHKNKEVISQFLSNAFETDNIVFVEKVQALWSGYGSLERWKVGGELFIVKYINNHKTNAHPRGWNSSVGHDRKVKSYEIERRFYQKFTSLKRLLNIPGLLKEINTLDYSIIVLDDLKNQFALPVNTISESQIQFVLKWLANFHAHCLHESTKELWWQGTYWHLNTRKEEWEKMEEGKLKAYAALLDKKLDKAQNKTIVHGDAKLANFLFNEEKAFAVDFQYVGKGAGIIDVMYFFSSCLNDEELYEHAERYLDNYFTYLKAQVGNPTEAKKIEEEWRGLYPIAWADFLRFLEGWSPGHWKLGSYASEQKQIALDLIRHED